MTVIEQRNPSLNWEPLPLDSAGQQIVWAWFRPAAAPNGLILAVPAALFAEASVSARLTVRQLVAATGLEPGQIHCWTLGGMTFDAAGGNSPLLDQIIPPNGNQNLLEITVWMMPSGQAVWPAAPAIVGGFPIANAGQAAYAGGGSDSDMRLLDAIDSCWNGILQLETRLGTIRKELGSNVSRLNSLNRDLSSDERRTCDSKDIQEWADARRWLRDSLSVLSRSIKEIDVGTTSGAGQRHKFEDLFRNHVVPKIPFPGLAQAVNEFESYRKTMQNVVASAQANMSRAGRDAEQRANSVLQRVGAKMRASRRK